MLFPCRSGPTLRASCFPADGATEMHLGNSCDARELVVSASRHTVKNSLCYPSTRWACASRAASTLSTQPSWGSVRTCLEPFANSASMPVCSEQPLTPTSRTWQSFSMGEAREHAESFQQQIHERPQLLLEQLAITAHTLWTPRRIGLPIAAF